MKRALLIGIAFIAGAAVTAFFWPPYHDMAPVIPLTERLARAAMAVAPGIVVTAVGLELLVGLPLVSWFFTWTHNLAIKGQAKSPVAAWRELRANEEASQRWRVSRRPRMRGDGTRDAGHADEPVRRAYANVSRDHLGHGDEDPLEYRPGRRDHPVEFCGGPFDGEILYFARPRGAEIVVPRLVPPKPGASRTEHYVYLDENPATGIRRYRYEGPDLIGEDDAQEQ